MRPGPTSTAASIGALAAVYFLTATFGLSLGAVGGFATAVWPPTGIALASLLLFGTRLWPGVALGAYLVNTVSGAPPVSAAGIALGNTLEALLGAYLLRRVAGFDQAAGDEIIEGRNSRRDGMSPGDALDRRQA